MLFGGFFLVRLIFVHGGNHHHHGDGLASHFSPHFPVPLSCRFVFDFLSKRQVAFPRVALCYTRDRCYNARARETAA